MARAVEDHDDEVLHVAIETLGDRFQIVGNRSIQVHRAFAGRADNDLFHIKIRRVQQSALFARGQNGDGVRRAGGAKIGTFQWINGNIHGGKKSLGRVRRQADLFADIEHRGFVALALADHDGAVHFHLIHSFAHGFHGDFIRFVAVAKSHGARGGNGAVFDHAQKFQT